MVLTLLVFHVAAMLYPFLFIVIPFFSIHLLTATPELNEMRQFLQLPWKPINKVTSGRCFSSRETRLSFLVPSLHVWAAVSASSLSPASF